MNYISFALHYITFAVFYTDDFTNHMYVLMQRFTKTHTSKPKIGTSLHPWTNDTQDKLQLRYRNAAKKRMRVNPSSFNRDILRLQNINLFSKYNDLKQAYYTKMVSGHRNGCFTA